MNETTNTNAIRINNTKKISSLSISNQIYAKQTNFAKIIEIN